MTDAAIRSAWRELATRPSIDALDRCAAVERRAGVGPFVLDTWVNLLDCDVWFWVQIHQNPSDRGGYFVLCESWTAVTISLLLPMPRAVAGRLDERIRHLRREVGLPPSPLPQVLP